MPRMIAKDLREYAGRPLKVGEAFEAEEGHVGVLTLMGLAGVANDQPAGHPARGTIAEQAAGFLRRKILTTGPRR